MTNRLSILFTSMVLSFVAIARAEEPVHLGNSAQLLVDDSLLAAKKGVVRHTHACQKLAKPVLQAERPWEGQRIYIYGTVLPGPDAGQFRMWYMSRCDIKANLDPRLTCAKMDYVMYAQSADGVTWTRPSLRLYDYKRLKR